MSAPKQQTASGSLQPCLQASQLWPTHTHTHTPH